MPQGTRPFSCTLQSSFRLTLGGAQRSAGCLDHLTPHAGAILGNGASRGKAPCNAIPGVALAGALLNFVLLWHTQTLTALVPESRFLPSSEASSKTLSTRTIESLGFRQSLR